MDPHEPARTTPALGTLLFCTVAVLFGWYFAELRFQLQRENPHATLSKLVEGSAATPFQYRVLVPAAVGALGPEGPAQTRRWFRWAEFAAGLAAIAALRAYLRAIAGPTAPVGALALAAFGLLLFNLVLPRRLPVYYPSDLPAVAVFTLGLLALRRRAWPAYYAVFALGTLNRETTCFLVLAWALTAWRREGWRSLVAHAAAQLAIWVAIKATLAQVFAANPGAGLYEWSHAGGHRFHLETNLRFALNPANWPYWWSGLGFVWLPALFFWRRVTDPAAQRLLLLIIPFLAGMFLVGNLYELRIYAELLPVFAGALVATPWIAARRAAAAP
jgi:hypothetical protein